MLRVGRLAAVLLDPIVCNAAVNEKGGSVMMINTPTGFIGLARRARLTGSFVA